MESSQLEPIDAYRQMAVIRRFEQRCLELSREGFVLGSMHLCTGQEAVPVGVCAALGPDDRVISTYRGHGWALARGVPVVPLLGEVCQRDGGINGGRCGSPLLSDPQVGFLGENSIVGAGVPIATGVALAARARGTGGVVAVSIGDGAMNQGSVHEGMVFAAAQNLPLLIICENNGWSEMTAISTMVRGDRLADRAGGYHIANEVVDGCDAEAVFEAAEWAAEEARAGRGPIFLECRTVRLGGHYNADIEHYRPDDDAAEARQREPIARLRARLVAEGVASEAELDAIEAEAQALVDDATTAVRAMGEPDPALATDHVVAGPAVATDQVAGPDGHQRDGHQPGGHQPGGHGPAPTAQGATPPPSGEPTELTYQRAVNLALQTELTERPEVLVYGEDVGLAGGIFGVSRGLQREFGAERVFDMPIAESAIMGSAVGASMEGMRPVVEVMWGDFLLVALDQLINQAANVRYINRSAVHAPMVVRLQQGATPGSCAQHSQSLEALLAHIPGLKVGLPATPADAYAMTRAAIADPDPCILIEARELYQRTGEVQPTAGPEAVGGARLHRDGPALAIITWGAMLHRALEAADRLAGDGTEVSVLDLRWLTPLDDEAIAEVVQRCGGRVLVVHEANLTGGFGAEIAARISERHFSELAAPVRRLGAADTRIAAAPSMQRAVIPGVDAIVRAAASFLPGDRSSAVA